MSDIEEMVKRLRAGTNGWNSNPAMKAAADALEAQAKRIAELEARAAMLLSACSKMNDEVSQILGKALRYPRYCDDQDVFPGAVESDGVFVGEHVCQSIADEAAQKIAQLEASLADSNEALQVMGLKLAHAEGQNERAFQMLSAYGVPKERAKTVANGIDVLMMRMEKAGHSANTVGGPTPVMDAAPACEPARIASETIAAGHPCFDPNGPPDHDWEYVDESFSHEFGTEICGHYECARCNAIKPE